MRVIFRLRRHKIQFGTQLLRPEHVHHVTTHTEGARANADIVPVILNVGKAGAKTYRTRRSPF